MAKAVRIHETGGSDVMRYEDVEVGPPGEGQVRLRQTAVGLNYIDVYFRTGLYPAPELPMTLGFEGAGVVEEVGDGVSDLRPGDRVAYCTERGAYATERLVAADRVVKLPGDIDDKTAAAMMLQGLTVEYLTRRTFRVEKGMTVLFHAAAGGVGLIACQWLKHLGATVIGTVGNEEKAKLAAEHGCDHPVIYTKENFVERVKEITGGQGVPVVYDSVGKDTWDGSLDCLRPRGMLVNYGNASGAVESFAPGILAQKGSLYLTRPTLFNYVGTRQELLDASQALFDVVTSGAVKIEVNQTYKLADAATAHDDLTGRKTTGSTVFLTE